MSSFIIGLKFIIGGDGDGNVMLVVLVHHRWENKDQKENTICKFSQETSNFRLRKISQV